MEVTLIDTNILERNRDPGAGETATILSRSLCGAENVVGRLRWLRQKDSVRIGGTADSHHLVYLMEGDASFVLEGDKYDVECGAGVYLGPSESVDVRHRGDSPLKLLHLEVPSSSSPGEAGRG